VRFSAYSALAAATAALMLPQAAAAQGPVDLGGDPVLAGPVTADNPVEGDLRLDPSLQLPGVVTGGLTVLGPGAVRVGGTVDPNGAATTFFVEYGQNGLLNLRTPSVQVGAGADPTRVVADLLDLERGSSYSYRVVSQSAVGTTRGETRSFTAPAATVDPRTGQLTVAGTSARGHVHHHGHRGQRPPPRDPSQGRDLRPRRA
jgi:hypothetical protein